MRRVGGMIGPGSKVGTLVSELFPMIDVERVPGELLFLMGTRIGFGGASLTAPAAQFPKLQLFNPDESGKLVTITTIFLSTDTTQILIFNNEIGSRGAAIGPGEFRDTRGTVGEPTSATIFFQNDASVLPSAGRLSMIADETLVLNDENGVVVLQPGTGWTVSALTVATQITVTFFWRERVAEQAELNL